MPLVPSCVFWLPQKMCPQSLASVLFLCSTCRIIVCVYTHTHTPLSVSKPRRAQYMWAGQDRAVPLAHKSFPQLGSPDGVISLQLRGREAKYPLQTLSFSRLRRGRSSSYPGGSFPSFIFALAEARKEKQCYLDAASLGGENGQCKLGSPHPQVGHSGRPPGPNAIRLALCHPWSLTFSAFSLLQQTFLSHECRSAICFSPPPCITTFSLKCYMHIYSCKHSFTT